MSLGALLKDLNGRGVELWSDSGRLKFRAVCGALTHELRSLIVEHKRQLLPHLEDEVRWRVEAFRVQLPIAGLIPFLIARADAPVGPGLCLSCGEPCRVGQRCGLCVQAAAIAISGEASP